MFKREKHEQVQIPKDILRVWEDALLHFARLPRGTRRSDMDRQQCIRKIIESESDAVHEMWLVFNEEREQIGRYLNDPKHQAVAYLLGFHLANVARSRSLLRHALYRYPDLRERLLGDQVSIVDLGCGTGALALSLLDFAPQASLTLVDQRQAFLDVAKYQAQHLGTQNIKTIRSRVEDLRLAPAPEQLSVFSFGYLWNELMRQPRAWRKMSQFVQSRKETPSLLLMTDSANQIVARRMMELREELVQAGYQVLYPCPHQLHCPMLDSQRDWCYSEAAWELPTYQKRIDHLMEVRREVVGASMYLFASPGLNLTTKANDAVVVGRPTTGRSAELLLCAPGGDLSRKAWDPASTKPLRGSLSRSSTR